MRRAALVASAISLAACTTSNPEFDVNTSVAGGSETSASTSVSGDGDGDTSASNSGNGDGDGDPGTGDGDGDPNTGDGDGDPTAGDGDGDPPELACADTLEQSCGDGLRGLGELCLSTADMVTAAMIPSDMEVADFDGDGRDDLAIAQLGDFHVKVMRGIDDGFEPLANLSVGASSVAVESGDFNDDGAPDLAVATVEPSLVHVWLGDGVGGFGDQKELVLPELFEPPLALAVGDLDLDGNQDLVVRYFHALVGAQSLGNGHFFALEPEFLFEGWHGNSLLIADVVGSGAPDVVIGAYFDNSLVVFENLDGFGLDPDELVILDDGFDGPTVIRRADVNQDGLRDIVTNSISAGAVLPVLAEQGESAFVVGEPVPGDSRYGFALADFDHDCAPDLLTTAKGFNTGILELHTNANDGSGTFAPTELEPAFSEQDILTVEVGDFDGSGEPDFVVAATTGVWVYYTSP